MSHPQLPDHVASLAHEDAGRKARLELFAIWQVKDQKTAAYFGISMAGLITILTLSHWLRVFYNKRFSRSGTFHRHVKAIAHILRRLNRGEVIGGVLFQPSTTFLAMLYFGINAILIFYDNPEKVSLTILAKRFGWLSLCNLCLTVFLALKNTPLSLLVGQGFDRVNVLHRCSGFVTILFAILHSTTYIHGLSTFGVMEQALTEPQQYAGAVACLSMLLILSTAIGVVRRRQYEMFYLFHVVLAAVVLVAVGLHRPDISKRALIITIVSASMWIADKGLRLSRWVYYGVGNRCTLTPLKENATRVTMHRQINATPGSMIFLWVPGVKMFQRHPFTLLSTHPATFVIQAQEGFTKSLYLAACRTPEVKFRAAIEGPYCVVPNTTLHNKVVLIAGGTGATFTIAIALEWARRHRVPQHRSTLEFIWIVRSKACFEWLDVELSELSVHPGVSISLYVSGVDSRQGEELFPFSHIRSSQEPADRATSVELQSWPDIDPETVTYDAPWTQQAPSSTTVESFKTGRPDLNDLIRLAISELNVDDRALVTGCGSSPLLHHVRQAVDRCRVASAPSIELHLEQYSI